MMKKIQYLMLAVLMAACIVPAQSLTAKKARQRMKSLDEDARYNIHQLLDMIKEDKHAGSEAKPYLPYEFRIPPDARMKEEVLTIDPDIRFVERTDAYQCIGGKATKEKVLRIVALPYTKSMRYCNYE